MYMETDRQNGHYKIIYTQIRKLFTKNRVSINYYSLLFLPNYLVCSAFGIVSTHVSSSYELYQVFKKTYWVSNLRAFVTQVICQASWVCLCLYLYVFCFTFPSKLNVKSILNKSTDQWTVSDFKLLCDQ